MQVPGALCQGHGVPARGGCLPGPSEGHVAARPKRTADELTLGRQRRALSARIGERIMTIPTPLL